MPKTALLILLAVVCMPGIYFAQAGRKLQTETWQNAPDSTTTKIRVITREHDHHKLDSAFLYALFKNHFKVDNNATVQDHVNTTPIPSYVGYDVKLSVDFQDTVVTVSGFRSYIGANPNVYNWSPIVYSSGFNAGWLIMQQVAAYSPSQVLYNSTVSK